MRPKLSDDNFWPSDALARRVRAEELRRLYLDERQTTIEIGRLYGVAHNTIHGRLRKLGIPTRRVGVSRHVTCCEPDCQLPIHRVLHKTNGSWYGRRCRLHWIIFRMEVVARYNDKHLGKDDEAWLRRMRQLLARVKRLNREVSQSLKPESAPATTSPAACPP
jgi:hypothetical protein